MSIGADAAELPSEGDNEGQRERDVDEATEAHVDDDNVPHPGRRNEGVSDTDL